MRRHLLAFSAAQAVALGAIGGLSLAASTPALAQAAARAWSIPAGPLEEALTRFAQDSGLMLSYTASDLAGKRSAGLSDTLSAPAALNALLSGTGLAAHLQPNGGYTVRPGAAATSDSTNSAPAGAAVLPAMTVRAAADSGESTEGTGSYTTRATRTATRLPLSLRETPQSATVITRQRMDDQAMTSIMDVVQNTPGVSISGSGGVGRESFVARGFTVGSTMEDGVVSTWESYIPGSRANLALYDRVEVVRGATGLLTGSGTPSAAINMVRKRPTREFQGAISASAGSWDDYSATVDMGGPLNTAGTVRGRFVVSRQDARSFRDVEAHDHDLFYGTVEADLGRNTLLTVGAYRQTDHTNNAWGGIPVSLYGQHLNLPRSFFPGNEWEYMDNQATRLFATLQHEFDNQWKLRLDASKLKSDNDILASSLYRAGSTDVFQVRAWQSDRQVEQTSYDLSASGPFTLAGRTHELVAGASSNRSDQVEQDYADGYLRRDVNLLTWDPRSLAQPRFMPRNRIFTQVRQRGAYLTTRLNLADPLKLILGARLDWYQYDNSRDEHYKVTRNLTRYAGLVYDIDGRHSAYASYTDIFSPQTNHDVQRRLLDPVVGKNYEIGIKGEYFSGALNASAALFQVDETHRARLIADQSLCPTYPSTSCYEASGLVRSRGVDLELQGEVMPSWQVGAGLTYVTAKYVKDANADNIGQPFRTDTPKHLLKLSTLYTLPSSQGAWRVGGSIYRQGSIHHNGTTQGIAWRNQQRSYALLDLVIGYRATRHLDLQLNISNVFDKTYYKAISRDPIWWPMEAYGDPRKIKLSAKYSF